MTTQFKCFQTVAAFCGLFVALSASASKAHAAEIFSVDSQNGDMALNTNNQFRRIDGEPRMSIYQRNDQDPDQQFDRLNGNNGGTLLKHRSTGKCLNAHRVWNGAELNVWDCNPNDPDQNFKVNDLDNGYKQIQRAGTNFCVDSPDRTNGGIVHLWTCDSNNPNQRWKSNQSGPISLSDLQRLLFGNAPSVVTSSYGDRNCNVWSGIYADCTHPALDIASSWRNAPIYSPVSGEVIRTNSTNGTVAVYSAKADVTFFFHHMNTITVNQGSVIDVGTQVGTQGQLGQATGPHLHFEARPGRIIYMANAIAQTIDPVDGVNRTR